MRLLEWPGPEIHKRSPDYEMAYMRASLEGYSNLRTEKTYEAMFGEKPKKGVPFWLVRLAIYYGALALGHERTKRSMAPADKAMLSCVMKLDEKVLRNNAVLWHRMYLHDLEPADCGGRELTD